MHISETIVGTWAYLLAGGGFGLVALYLVRASRLAGPSAPSTNERVLMLALWTTAGWALATGIDGSASALSGILESLRNLAWLAVMFQLVRSAPNRPHTVDAVYGVLAGLLLVEAGLDWARIANFDGSPFHDIVMSTAMLMRMLSTVGLLVLAHNLYILASTRTRDMLRLPLTALAALWIFDLNFYTIAYLAGAFPVDLVMMRAVIALLLVPFFALATARRGEWKLQLSRKIAYRSLSLFAIAAYLGIMIGLAQLLQWVDSDFVRPAQTILITAMSVAALVLLPSDRFRAWFRVKIAKHFFQHRYDYRAEWMRFTDTIGRPGDGGASFDERVIQAIADITDSPAGLLLTVNDGARLELQSRFNWPTIDVPARVCTTQTISYFVESGRIVELDRVRQMGAQDSLEDRALPEWLRAEPRAWAIVPLVHFGRLAGLVVLARPLVSRTLDWEDFDLLRVVGRQLASYLAEARAHEALLEAEQFDEFNRRIAFVMHDIKNIVSQLSLVSRNAERHADNPEFRADMVATLQNSVSKMNMLIARLTRYARPDSEAHETIDMRRLVKDAIAQKRSQHEILLFDGVSYSVRGNAMQLEQIFGHLLQNAIDASPGGEAVLVKMWCEGLSGCVEIRDQGVGMSAEFVRSKLFKPFVSSKADGFGIGAFEARSLVEAMDGSITVESREGKGSSFVVRIPLACDLSADEPGANNHGDPRSEVLEK